MQKISQNRRLQGPDSSAEFGFKASAQTNVDSLLFPSSRKQALLAPGLLGCDP